MPKADGIIRLYVNYRRLNKITIKNQYPLPLVGKLFNRLSYTKIFIKLDLYNIYYIRKTGSGAGNLVSLKVILEPGASFTPY